MTVETTGCDVDGSPAPVSEPLVGTDGAGFDAWVAPHLGVLRALARREVGATDADDLVQDALVRAWRRRTTFDPRRGSARAWLAAVLLDQARRRRGRLRPWARAHPGADVPVDAPDSTRLDIEQRVRALPRRQREVITLHYLADLPPDEVAAVLGIAVGSVKAHLAAARQTLRKTWEQ